MIVIADLELEGPGEDVADLLRGPAGATERADLMPPLRIVGSRYTRRPTVDGLDDDGPDEDPGERLRAPTYVSEAALSALREQVDLRLQEAAVYKSKDHPRWPKGTPGGKGGEFMAVGQTFKRDGKTWQIASIVKGKVYAHEASASYSSVQTRAFDVKQTGEQPEVSGAEYVPPVAVPKGGKSTSSQVTIVDPYVDHASHNPSLPIPEASSITPEQWQRFGEADQRHYIELMERFGPHKPGAAKQHVDKSYSEYTAKAQQLVKAGYQQQYGSSSGYSLSIAAGAKHGYGGHGIEDTPEMAKLREESLALQAEHKAAVQWDLYNRTQSPDLFVVHKDGEHGPEWWHENFIKGNKPVMSGLSQSFKYRASFFGSHSFASKLAIRHVLLASQSAQPVPGESHFPGELEISVSEQLKADSKGSIAFTVAYGKNKLTATQNQWLEGVTSQPIGGHVFDMLRDSIENGTKLPTPPAPANVIMDGASGKTWVDPPIDAAKVLPADKMPDVISTNYDPAVFDKDLPWMHLDENGVPKPVTGKDAGVYAGQYFMGLKGTLYWVGPDPGNTSGYPFRIHKIVNGEFNGETMAYNPDYPGYYLDAKFDLSEFLEDQDKAPEFNPSEWVNGTEPVFLEDFAKGDKFKLNGTAYEVTSPGGTQIGIVELETGKTGKINGNYKSVKLVALGSAEAAPMDPAEAFTWAPLAVGDEVATADGHGVVAAVDGDVLTVDMTHGGYQVEVHKSDADPWQSPLAPKVGLTFAMRRPEDPPGSPKVKATVTKITAAGDVQVNLKPGKVVIAKDEWSAYATSAFDPEAWSIAETPVKLRDYKPGMRFQGSQGNQTLRPYEVLAVPPAGPVTVRNLDTGKVSTMSRNVSLRELLAKPEPGSAAAAKAELPEEPAASVSTPESTDLAEHIDPANFEMAANQVPWTQVETGMLLGSNKPSILVTGKDADGTVHLKLLKSGAEQEWTPDELTDMPPATVWIPSGSADPTVPDGTPDAPSKPFVEIDGSKYVEGDYKPIGQMEPGSLFKTVGKKGVTYYKLSDDGTQSINLKTGKSYPAKGGWKVTQMEPVGRASAPEPAEAPPSAVGSFVYDDWEDSGVTTTFADAEVGAVLKSTGGTTTGMIIKKVPSDQMGVAMGEVIGTGLGDPENAHEYMSLGPIPLSDYGEYKVMVPKSEIEAPQSITMVEHGDAPGAALETGDYVVLPTGGQGTVQGSMEWMGSIKYKVEPHDGGAPGWFDSADVNLPSSIEPPATGTIDAAELKDKPGALFVHKGATMSVAADQSLAAQGELIAIAPDGAGWLLTPGHPVSPLPGKGATKVLDVNQQVVLNGQAVTISEIHQNPNGEDPGGSVSVEFPDGTKLAVDGSTLTEAPSQVQQGDYVEAFWPGGGSLGPPKTHVGHVKQVKDDGAVQLYGSTLWHAPEQVTVLDSYPYKPGDAVQTSTGVVGQFVGWKHDGTTQKAVAQVDVTGDYDVYDFQPDELALSSVEIPGVAGVVLNPKSDTMIPYEHLGLGDVSQLKTLKAGDQFKFPASADTYQVIDPADESSYAEVAAVLPGGGLGTPSSMGMFGDATVVVMALNKQAANEVPVPAAAVDVEGLPDAIDYGFVGYKSHKGSGGKWSHHMVKTMPEGVVFADLNGKQWKVKQAGDKPVITDGEQLFKVNGNLRGKDLNQPAVKQSPNLVDNSPALGEQPAAPVLTHNFAGGHTLHSLDVMPGDVFKHIDTLLVVKAKANDGWVSAHPPGQPTAVTTWPPYYTPAAYGLSHQQPDALAALAVSTPDGPATQTGKAGPYVEAQAPDGTTKVYAPSQVTPMTADEPDESAATPSAAPSLYTKATPTGALKVGDKFTSAPGSTTVKTVTNVGGADGGADNLAWEDENGATGTISTLSAFGGTVYTEPDAPDVPEPDAPGLTKWIQGVGVHPAKQIQDFKPGDTLVGAQGAQHEIVDVQPSALDPDGMTTLTFASGTQHTKPNGTSLGWEGPPDPSEQQQPVDPATVETIDTPEDFAPPTTVPADPVIDLQPVLQPFGSRLGPGGIYKHERLSELQPGQLFTDKSGTDYKLIENGPGMATFQDVASGKVYAEASGLRVKRTAPPPDPGPQVAPVLSKLVQQYGSLDAIPPMELDGYGSATGENGKVKQPRLGHLKSMTTFSDVWADDYVLVTSWLDKALVYIGDGEYRLAPAATRIRIASA